MKRDEAPERDAMKESGGGGVGGGVGRGGVRWGRIWREEHLREEVEGGRRGRKGAEG